MKHSGLLFWAVAHALAWAPGSVEAQSITATYTGVNPGSMVTGTLNDDGSELTYFTGVAAFTSFEAFCVEPVQPISTGEMLIYQTQDPGLLANSDRIARLVGGYLQSSRTGEDAAAVQWAIWEIVLENRLPASLTDGNVRITAAANQDILLLANRYLADINSYPATSLTCLQNEERQDMVTWTVVPEPGCAALAMVCGLGFLGRRRR